MRISTAQTYDRSLSSMKQLGNTADKLTGQIASGKKVVNASDDAGSYARLTQLKRNAAATQADTTNLNLAKTLVAQSDAALDSIETQLQRAKELAIQGNSGTVSPEQKKVLGVELNAILDDIVALANSKDARGQPLFGGATSATPFARDAAGVVRWQGTGTAAKIPVGEAGEIQAVDSGERLFTAAGGGTDIFAALQAVAGALSDGESLSEGSLAALDTSLDQIATARASFGARGARLDLEGLRLDDLKVDRDAERAGLEGVDTEQAIIELQRTITVLQATQASFSKLSSLSLFDYLR